MAISNMEAITISKAAQTHGTPSTNIEEFRMHVAIYVNTLVQYWFVVTILTSTSIFNPVLLAENESRLSEYGTVQITTLAYFYGSEAAVQFEGTTYIISPAVLNRDELLSEWAMFRRAFFRRKRRGQCCRSKK